MFYFPTTFGTLEKAKSLYKYHRLSGYIVWSLVLVNCILGTQSTWFLGVWDNTWVWVVLGVLAVLGVGSRIRGTKMRVL